MRKDVILVGRFGAAHGVRGEIRLRSFTTDPGAIAGYGPLLDARGETSFVIESLRPVRNALFVAKLRGIRTRTEAEALANLELFLPRASLPHLAEEEFYLADLVGLEAVTENGASIGRIVAVPDYGGGALLEIAPAQGGETVLLPFTKKIVPIVDLARGRVVVAPPAEVDGEDIASIGPDQESLPRRRAGP